MTSSSTTQALGTLLQLAMLSAIFLQAVGVCINYGKHTPPVHAIKYLGYLIKDRTVGIPEDQRMKTREVITKIQLGSPPCHILSWF